MTIPTFICKILHEENHEMYKGYNRAQNSILEMCILVSRLGIIDINKIYKEMNYLRIAVEKTANEDDLIIWEKLKEKIGNILSIGTIDTNDSITKIGCNYKVAFGAVSSALKYLESCKNIKIYCLKSLSKEKHGDNSVFFSFILINELLPFLIAFSLNPPHDNIETRYKR